MTGTWSALRRRILTPDVSATKLAVRGFHEKSPAARELLEAVGASFLAGYAEAAQASDPLDAEAALERVARSFRGFAYEGATMAFAVRDGLPLGRTDHVARFLAGRADAHIYMAYVGVGWAMARLPRFRWSKLYAPDPLLRWLVLDGYGFHQAYFHTERYVRQQFRSPRFSWPPDDQWGYANRAIDQGIGRAAWFVGGADPRVVAALLDAFEPARRADLYSGAGLAATYAGGADAGELTWFFEHAGAYRSQLAQGSAFAAGARVRAGLVAPHNEVATEVFCGLSPADATKVTDRALPDPTASHDRPAYEVWRQRIADELASLRA
ncbi:MAG: DUF1702 family protein [Micromonosporaceae bacterium]